MCLDGRAAALRVAAASMVAGVADKPGQQPAATSPSAADPSPPPASTAPPGGVRVSVRLEPPDTRSGSDRSGIVCDGDGRIVAGATVLVIPDAPQYRARTSRRFEITTSGADGRYHYRGLRAGGDVTAVRISPDDVYGLELWQQSSAAGAPLALAQLAAAAIALRLTPAPVVRRSPAR